MQSQSLESLASVVEVTRAVTETLRASRRRNAYAPLGDIPSKLRAIGLHEYVISWLITDTGTACRIITEMCDISHTDALHIINSELAFHFIWKLWLDIPMDTSYMMRAALRMANVLERILHGDALRVAKALDWTTSDEVFSKLVMAMPDDVITTVVYDYTRLALPDTFADGSYLLEFLANYHVYPVRTPTQNPILRTAGRFLYDAYVMFIDLVKTHSIKLVECSQSDSTGLATFWLLISTIMSEINWHYNMESINQHSIYLAFVCAGIPNVGSEADWDSLRHFFVTLMRNPHELQNLAHIREEVNTFIDMCESPPKHSFFMPEVATIITRLSPIVDSGKIIHNFIEFQRRVLSINVYDVLW